MKAKFILFTLTVLSPLFSLAQPMFTANLTIFSEDGDKFYLVLNGERQNNVPQTNLRIEDLPQPYYNAKIIFEDKSIADVSKNNLAVADPGSGQPMDVTYKIKKDGSGKAKLRYFSAIPIAQGYVAPSNVYVMHYGNPAGAMGGTVSQTTTTTTTTGGSTVGASMNVNGMNVNVSVNDPLMNGTVSHTTTTTTTSSYSDDRNYRNSEPVNDCYAMKSSNFQSAKATISNESFDETRLSTAKSIIAGNCLTSDQVLEICKLFSFEQSRLDFAKCAYGKTVDQNNYFKVNNAFSFSASKDELNNYISGR
ncbi:MAG TPA: DUF4476 domain-containing protein [Flavipsychrobacter sp.]|nr:DUF4476 domain-containing protein [Flavipsychrobacter sp.]